jgi:hypothetical protein
MPAWRSAGQKLRPTKVYERFLTTVQVGLRERQLNCSRKSLVVAEDIGFIDLNRG